MSRADGEYDFAHPLLEASAETGALKQSIMTRGMVLAGGAALAGALAGFDLTHSSRRRMAGA